VLAAVVQAAWSAVALIRFRVRTGPAPTAAELA
jgi:hypothetical protein